MWTVLFYVTPDHHTRVAPVPDRGVVSGPVLSPATESTQWALAAHRLPDTGDLLVNGAGSLVGTLTALTAVGIGGFFDRRSRTRPSSLAGHDRP